MRQPYALCFPTTYNSQFASYHCLHSMSNFYSKLQMFAFHFKLFANIKESRTPLYFFSNKNLQSRRTHNICCLLLWRFLMVPNSSVKNALICFCWLIFTGITSSDKNGPSSRGGLCLAFRSPEIPAFHRASWPLSSCCVSPDRAAHSRPLWPSPLPGASSAAVIVL